MQTSITVRSQAYVVLLGRATHWMSMHILLYLVIDNARGYGTDEHAKQYTNILLTEFNIEIIHQVSRSPFTNVLDLGV